MRALILLPAVVYGLSILYLAVDIPRWDDYKVFFDYLIRSGAERLDFLVVPHAEHRIVFTRLVADAMVLLLGRVDFRLLVYFGNVALFLLFWLLFRWFRRTGLPLKLFLPVPYLLFFVPLGENTTWATGSIQNFYVLLFALLALICFEKKRLPFLLLSIVCATAAAFTSGSGLLVFVALLLWSLLDVFDREATRAESEEAVHASKREALARTAVLVAVASAVFLVYFDGYAMPSQDPANQDPLANPLRSLIYFFVFLGSYLQIVVPACVVGVATALLFVHLTRRRYHRRNPIGYWFGVFLIMNALAATYARAGFGVQQALSSRYVVISILIVILLYVAILETADLSRIGVERFRGAFLAVTLLLSALSLFVNAHLLLAKRSELRLGMARWQATGVGLDYPKQKRAAALLRLVSSRGIYVPPAPPERR